METVEQIIDKILSNNPFSIHPSRVKEYQFGLAIKELARQIDRFYTPSTHDGLTDEEVDEIEDGEIHEDVNEDKRNDALV